jgi:hypothetical protein
MSSHIVYVCEFLTQKFINAALESQQSFAVIFTGHIKYLGSNQIGQILTGRVINESNVKLELKMTA